MPNLQTLKIAIARPLDTLFDYLPPAGMSVEEIPIGARIKVPFGRTTTIGYVALHGESLLPKSKLKSILEIIDPCSLFPEQTWQFLCKAKSYYHHSLGEVITTGLPKALKEGKPLVDDLSLVKSCYVEGLADDIIPDLTPEQASILNQIETSSQSKPTYLIEGVTGSGKTEIYLQLLMKVQAQQKSALVLLPEISLTPQTLGRFQKRLKGKLLVYHSKLTPKARFCVWQYVKKNPDCIVIGTRSALFLPFDKLEAIIVDEEHDNSFKQQDGFKYSARDMAVLRGHIDHCTVLLGSATPSFESLHNAQTGKYQHLKLTRRINQQHLPSIDLIDVRHNKLQGGMSAKMLDKIKQHVNQGNQVLLFLNRRGYAPSYMCFDCGYMAGCKRCDAQLIVHQSSEKLVCHHCDKVYTKIKACPECEGDMSSVGIGTEQLEHVIEESFPDTTKLRIDSDTTRLKGALEEKLDLIQSGEAQIIIGTQLLAKGHHFPNVTLVAIVDVDGGIFSSDFRAVERMGQLITQVAGRAGRAAKAGEVLLQSNFPEHRILQTLVHEGYEKFSQDVLQERENAHLPPFAHMAIIRAQAKNAQKPREFLESLKNELISKSTLVEIWGPISAMMAKKQGNYRFQLLLQSQERKNLHQLLAKVHQTVAKNPLKSSVRWSLDVDPTEMR